jgi:putative NADH-flavin reductase
VKIIVFGASKGVGAEMVRAALEAGHEVTAFARGNIPTVPNLRVIQSDALNAEAVAAALSGHDATVCALGGGNAANDTRSRGTANIVSGMNAAGLKRLVCISSFAVGESRQGFFANFVWLFLRKALEEHEKQEAIIKASGLDWTIIRPTQLTNAPKRSAYRVGRVSPGFGSAISRADVADFALKTLTDGSYIREAPTITN